MNARVPFREQMLKAREDAIVASVNRLLAEKGYDLMTVDEVAADVGIAKASLYKHFDSKEALAAAAMVRLLDRSLGFMANVSTDLPPLDKLKAMVRWTMMVHLQGEMPSLPSTNSTLRAALVKDKDYTDRLVQVSDALGEWIEAARADGSLRAELPAELVLYTLFARACDPVLDFMKASGTHSDDQIADWVLAATFGGLARQTP
jgi:AcrR family transcriptional regulator